MRGLQPYIQQIVAYTDDEQHSDRRWLRYGDVYIQ